MSFGDGALACVMGSMNLLRPLGLAGVRCAAVAPPGSPTLHSRFTRAAIEWPDVSQDEEGLVEALLRFAAAQPAPPVLYYEEDDQLLFVSRHRARLAPAFRFVIADADLVETLVDKARFQAFAERLGLPVPRTRRLHPTPGSAPPDLDLRFPLVVKPLTRGEAWFGIELAGKAVQVDGPEELRALWPRLVAVGIELLAQELIPGPETRIESYHVYVDAAGATAGEFTGRKIRTYPTAFGHSTALTITDADTEAADVAALGRDLVRRLNLRGVAKFDFKRAPDGALSLLEVNPRFNLWHHLGAIAGVNLPALVYADMTGQPRPAAGCARPGANWCRPAGDLFAARDGGVPLGAWLLWTLRCEAKQAIAWDDPMPLVHAAWAKLRPRRYSGKSTSSV
jgi:predicted ATP-grasp superfamily ATP-dependent carboligase